MFRPSSLAVAVNLAKLQEQAIKLTAKRTPTSGTVGGSLEVEDDDGKKDEHAGLEEGDEAEMKDPKAILEGRLVKRPQETTVRVEFGDKTTVSDSLGAHTARKSFPQSGQPLFYFLRATVKVPDAQIIIDHHAAMVGLVFCGLQSSGWTNVISAVFVDKNMLFGRGKRYIEQLSVGEYHDVPFDRGRRGVVKRMMVCLPVDWGLEGTYQVFDRGRHDDEQLHGRKDPNPPCGRGRCGVVESLLQGTALTLKYMPFDRGRWIELRGGKDLLHCNGVSLNINSECGSNISPAEMNS